MAQTKDGKAIMQTITFAGRCCSCGGDTLRVKEREKVELCLCAWETGLAIALEFCVPCARNIYATFGNELEKLDKEEFCNEEEEVTRGG